MNPLKTTLFSILHNALAFVVPPLLAAAVTTFSNGPEGGAGVYASSHPWVFGVWATTGLVLRDLLKNVPAFGTAATAPAAQTIAQTAK